MPALLHVFKCFKISQGMQWIKLGQQHYSPVISGVILFDVVVLWDPFQKYLSILDLAGSVVSFFCNKLVSKTVYFQLKKPTYSDSNNKVAQISQVHIGLCVVALLGEAGPVANRSFCSHRQDRDGLNSSHLQGSSGSHSHKVSSVVVLTAGQLQLLTNWDLQENTV